jgi:hypothetical protein
MTTPTTNLDRRRRLARRLVLSLVLGVVATLALCLLFSFRSSAQERTQWRHILERPDRLGRARLDKSWGKTILEWAPLRADQITAFQNSGGSHVADLRVGNVWPPTWSAYWDEEQFRTADQLQETCTEIAIGWPLRAFRCSYATPRVRPPSPPPVIGGWLLPRALVARGMGGIVSEPRAVPFRPIWSGLVLNTLTFAAGAFAVLSLIAFRPRAMDTLTIAGHPRVFQRPSRVGILVSVALGICTSFATAVLLPMTLRRHTVTAHCTTQTYTFEARDIFWKQRTIRLSEEALVEINISTPRGFDAELARLDFSTDPARRKRGPRDEIDGGGPATFSSTETGWPFACLWGARWHSSGIQPMREALNLVEVPKSRWLGWAINRGLTPMPTRPIPLGWFLNTLIYSLAWLCLLMMLGAARRGRRHRRGQCVRCVYDRRGTPLDAPCPECGHVPRVTCRRHDAPALDEQ